MSDRERVIAAEVIVKAWRDEDYKKTLLADPVGVLRAAGLDAPGAVTVFENSSDVVHAVVPRDVDAADVAGELASLLPLPAGQELRLHQNTDTQWFLVIPLAPEEPGLVDEDALDFVVGGTGGNGGNGGEGVWLGFFGGNGGAGGNGGLLFGG